jgi:hypothetical protein
MIRFAKELYLTGFAIIFRLSRVKDIAYKAGGAIVAVTLVESCILMGMSWYIEILVGKKNLFLLPKPAVLIAYFALFFVNGYFLFFRKHGIKFANEFDSLPKSRRVLLVASSAVIVIGAVVFSIFSAIAHRRFLEAQS